MTNHVAVEVKDSSLRHIKVKSPNCDKSNEKPESKLDQKLELMSTIKLNSYIVAYGKEVDSIQISPSTIGEENSPTEHY